jgi:hypothetical protein
MKKKVPKKMLGPTLQEFELVPVTDPVERAALDRRCRAAAKASAASERKAGKAEPNQRKRASRTRSWQELKQIRRQKRAGPVRLPRPRLNVRAPLSALRFAPIMDRFNP